jgi:hypothetical protein
MDNLAIAIAAAPVDLGDQNFKTEKALGASRNFGMIIENNTDADVTVVLFDDYKGTGSNVVTDGTITTGVTGTSTGSKTIAEMKKYFAKKPARVLITQIESTSENQLTKALLINESSIFGDQPTETVNLAMFKDPGYLNNKLINVDRPYQLDDETKVAIVIPKRKSEDNPTQTTINLFFGAIYNQSKALYEVAKLSGAAV